MRHLQLILLILFVFPSSYAAATELLVHLPEVPSQETEAVAEAVDALGHWIDEQSAEDDVTVRMFRRWEDAAEALRSTQGAIVLADPSFLLDAPSPPELEPIAGLVSGESLTQRLVVVVPSGTGVERLVELRGASLSVARTTGPSLSTHLETNVFQGRVQIDDWFTLREVDDDFTATANALFGETQAALVSERNPLLQSRLPADLTVVYTSPPLPLPVLAAPVSWSSDRRQKLRSALESFSTSPQGPAALETLGADAFRASINTTASSTPSASVDGLLIDLSSFQLEPPAPPEASALQFVLGVELPRVPISSDLVQPDHERW